MEIGILLKPLQQSSDSMQHVLTIKGR